jgi:hypothetical protein
MADFVTNELELVGSALILVFGRIRIIAKRDYRLLRVYLSARPPARPSVGPHETAWLQPEGFS